jgi:PelA/Pel-15E family pectate lyase
LVRQSNGKDYLGVTGTTLATCFLAAVCAATEVGIDGRRVVWHPLTFTFQGPSATETDSSPNPFLDIRLQIIFTGPAGQRYDVPGFFDGDGEGGPSGSAWRARFSPDVLGKWTYAAEFRRGAGVAVQLEPDAGETLAEFAAAGSFEVAPRDPHAPGFLKRGRLAYDGTFYLKFADGSHFLRGGTDEPENFLGYAGFDRTPGHHKYEAHLADWREGDPDWGDGRGRAIIGAINYLAAQHVNSIYFLTMNVGGDGRDVWPWSTSESQPIDPRGNPQNDNLHFDVGKLRQWEIVFDHAQRQGLFLHVVFNEAEEANKRELDDGELGPERKLYYRELIARFGHHLAMQWNLCEEYNLNFDFGAERVRAFADYVRDVDPYDHPITVHSAGDPVEALRFTFGDERFAMTSIQLNQRPIHEVTEAMRGATQQAGRPLPVSLDEFTLDRGQRASHIPVDDAEGQRREKLWPTYFSGGMIEFILDDLLKTDSFNTPEREALWRYTWYARRFMEENLPFWEMEPVDGLAAGGATLPVGVGRGHTIELAPQVFAKRGEVYAVYLPVGSPSGTLDLCELKEPAEQRWFNPRSGEFVGEITAVTGGARHELGAPPSDGAADWVVLIRRRTPAADRDAQGSIDTSGFQSGAHHWRRIRDDSRVIQALPDQPSFAPTQVDEIVANILLFQRDNGGWPKDYDMLAVLTDEQKDAVRATASRTDTSFDNDNVHSQVDYLARAAHRRDLTVRRDAWRDACVQGLDYMLSTQLECGGFPQRVPNSGGYAAHITFNDGVTIGILNVLKDAAGGVPHWSWLDSERRDRAASAVERGIECILNCQIRAGDRLTGWCQQHDPQALVATSARTFELASICPQETTEIARFLMRVERPDARTRTAIESAAAWLQSARLSGIRVEKVTAPAVEFERHRANFDVLVLEDTTAPPIWARHYEIGTDRPIFAGRDAVKRYSLAEIERERRTGTPWYGVWPRKLLDEEYPAWRAHISD